MNQYQLGKNLRLKCSSEYKTQVAPLSMISSLNETFMPIRLRSNSRFSMDSIGVSVGKRLCKLAQRDEYQGPARFEMRLIDRIVD